MSSFLVQEERVIAAGFFLVWKCAKTGHLMALSHVHLGPYVLEDKRAMLGHNGIRLMKILENPKIIRRTEMRHADVQKLVDAGFTLVSRSEAFGSIAIRTRDEIKPQCIEKGFKTPAALDDRMEELLKDPMWVEVQRWSA